jgi:1-acyl-sn-glycerol-3-phosphate acyltransferase
MMGTEREPLSLFAKIMAIMRLCVFYVFSFFYIPYIILRGIFATGDASFYPAARRWCRVGARLFKIRVHTEGLDSLETDRTYVVIANHRSHFDIFAIVAAFGPRQTRWVAKKELGKVPIFGLAIRVTHQILIDRKDNSQAVAQLKKHLGSKGSSVVFFGEGERAPTTKVLPFKKGGAAFAIEAGLPVVPIAISGSERLLPKHSMMPVPGEIRVMIGDPIPVDNLTKDDRGELSERVRSTVVTMLAKVEPNVENAES